MNYLSYMILSGYYEEHELLSWYEQGDISALQYIEHHSPGMSDRFKEWCHRHASMEDEAAAMDFLDEYNGLFLDSEELSTEKSNSIDNEMFENWRKDTQLLNDLCSSHAALHISLWRYRNPTSHDKHCCAGVLNVSMEDIEKWWNVVDFLNFENNGHFQPIRLDENTLDKAIKQICQQYI